MLKLAETAEIETYLAKVCMRTFETMCLQVHMSTTLEVRKTPTQNRLHILESVHSRSVPLVK